MEESSSLENTVWMLYDALESRCLMNDTSIDLYRSDVCVCGLALSQEQKQHVS